MIYRRSPDVVWRLAPDRVLVRRLGDTSDEGAAELFGLAALIWVVLDEPAGLTEISGLLLEADIGEDLRIDAMSIDALRIVVEQLCERRWIQSKSATETSGGRR